MNHEKLATLTLMRKEQPLIANCCREARVASRSRHKLGLQALSQVYRVFGETGTPVATKCSFKGPNACISADLGLAPPQKIVGDFCCVKFGGFYL